MNYDLSNSTWFNNLISESVTGIKVLVFLCATEKDASQFIEALKTNPYTLKTIFTQQHTYKIGLFLSGKFSGIEIPKSHPEFNEFKHLIKGNITYLTTGYYRDDKSLFLEHPIKILSGQSN